MVDIDGLLSGNDEAWLEREISDALADARKEPLFDGVGCPELLAAITSNEGTPSRRRRRSVPAGGLFAIQSQTNWLIAAGRNSPNAHYHNHAREFVAAHFVLESAVIAAKAETEG
jgi:hypothetical protein